MATAELTYKTLTMTTNHNYNIPEKGTADWHILLNENFNKIDTGVEIRDKEANLEEYMPKPGAKFLAIDTGVRYIGDGSEWQELSLSQPAIERFDALESRIEALEEDINNQTGGSEESSDLHVPFRDNSYWDYFTEGIVANQSITETDSGNGSALRVTIDEGDSHGTSMFYQPEDHLGRRVDELHARYWMYLDPDYDLSHQQKLHAIGNREDQGWGGRVSDGTGGWTTRIALHEYNNNYPDELGIEFYTYHADGSGDWGDHDRWADQYTVTPGEWTQLDLYVEVNTPGENDGLVRGWVNGELGHELTNMKFRAEGYEEFNIDEYWFNVYHGGNQVSPRNNFLEFKDLELWADQGQQL